jgi:hypothetical protein
MASTGIAATLIFNGATIHSTFSIPADRPIDATFIPQIGPLTLKYSKLKLAEVIIIDEVSMVHKHILAILDNTLRLITRINKPFGNKIVILGGDWKQLLPVVKVFHNIVNASIEASIQSLDLYDLFEHYHLTINMRAITDPEYARLLESVCFIIFYYNLLN